MDENKEFPSGGHLSQHDHLNMNSFLGHILDAHKDGTVTRDKAILALAHVIAAVDEGNVVEVRNWFEQGRKFVTRL